MKILIILTIFLNEGFSQLNVPTPKPAYSDIQIDRFEQLDANLTVCDFSSLKVRKVNGVRSLVGQAIVNEPLDRDVTFEAKAYKKQGNEYRLLPYRIPSQPLCEVLQTDDYFYPEIQTGSDLPKKVTCPMEAKVYHFYNVTVKFDKVPKTILPSGDYAMEVSNFRNTDMILKIRVYLTIVQV